MRRNGARVNAFAGAPEMAKRQVSLVQFVLLAALYLAAVTLIPLGIFIAYAIWRTQGHG